ncbi:MAG: hypothetical protein HKN73_13115, partial [Gemmatimonadetes bacterium]|nr:hypothetical protein [Gemmatimonadota bacterium]
MSRAMRGTREMRETRATVWTGARPWTWRAVAGCGFNSARPPVRGDKGFARLAGITGVLMGALGSPLLAQGPPGAPGGGPNQNPLPLEGARKATFTATEGTWISLDVSPDGQTIVFDLLGDLYTMPMAGGKATQLTSGMAFDAQP